MIAAGNVPTSRCGSLDEVVSYRRFTEAGDAREVDDVERAFAATVHKPEPNGDRRAGRTNPRGLEGGTPLGLIGAAEVEITAGELHRRLGYYLGRNHRIPVSYSVIRALMGEADRIVTQPPKGNGPSLRIRYRLPR